MLVRFKVWGSLRFLSHAEMMKLFQRACVRAGVRVRYSEGHNPRPKMSLPLPKTVGVEADDDLLSLQLDGPWSSFDAGQFQAKFSGQLPRGCEVLSVRAEKTKTSIQPVLATYVFEPHPEWVDEQLKATINRLLASESLVVERHIDAKGNTRKLDVRGFLKSVRFEDDKPGPAILRSHEGKKGHLALLRNGCESRTRIVVECKISPAGSIRIDEILKLLQLDPDKLAAPIRRASVQWQRA